MDGNQHIHRFLDRLGERDGHPPLSDAKMESLRHANRYLTIEEDGDVVAVGAVAEHTGRDDLAHWSVETAVDPSMRFAEFEDLVLSRTLELVPNDRTTTVWSRRPSLEASLTRAGFVSNRSLAHMHVELPLDEPDSLETTPMLENEDATLIAINAAAFSQHPEAASLDSRELADLRSQSWFDLDGVRMHRTDSGVDAFCWTKVHPGGIGEIYRIGVAPSAQGRGLGGGMVKAGFRYLNVERGCTTGALWVDESNLAAMHLYESLGMETIARNREFRR